MPEYPLRDHPDQLHAASGRRLDQVTLDALADLSIADIQISAETLHSQADVAEQAGFFQLATNLRRAAELTRVPSSELLGMYELLRPQRASYAELLDLATTLEQHYQAPQNAALVREAAAVYHERGLLKRE
jgi:propanediol dehydratase small subunit